MRMFVQIAVQLRTYSALYSSPSKRSTRSARLSFFLSFKIRRQLFDLRHAAQDVEIHAPAPLVIGRRLRRQQMMILPTFVNRFVDQRDLGNPKSGAFLPMRPLGCGRRAWRSFPLRPRRSSSHRLRLSASAAAYSTTRRRARRPQKSTAAATTIVPPAIERNRPA